MTAVLPNRTDRRLRRAPLVALASASFCYVTAETLPVGLLPQIGHGLHVGEAQVGLLLTVYAAVAGLTAIPLTALTIGVPRHRLIAVCLVAFTVSQALAAVAPTFAVLAASRLVSALAHGVFWSAIAPVAARLAPPGQAGRATSLVFVGNSLALVAGVPIGTALGQLTGWRVAFAVLGAAGAVATVALLRLLPSLPATGTARRAGERIAASVSVMRDRGVASVCLVTVAVVIGHFAAFTYLAPIARHAGGLSGFALSALLLGYGAAGLVGNLVAGREVDRRPGTALVVCLVLEVAGLLLLAATPGAGGTVVGVLAWGAAFSAVPVSLQSAVLRVAPGAQDAASAVYVVAFQIGIGGGALVGDLLVGGGHLGSLPVVAAATACAALLAVRLARRAFPRRVVQQPAVRTQRSGGLAGVSPAECARSSSADTAA